MSCSIAVQLPVSVNVCKKYNIFTHTDLYVVKLQIIFSITEMASRRCCISLFKMVLFIYLPVTGGAGSFCAGSSVVGASRGCSRCGVWASHRAAALVWHGLSSTCGLGGCGSWAELLHGIWAFPRLGNKPVSVPCVGRPILYQWATREALYFFSSQYLVELFLC